MVSIVIDELSKSFGAHEVLKDLDLEIPARNYVCLLGPSGCGKSTFMRIIAGLEEANNGRVLFGDKDVSQLTCAKRDVGMAFQNYALYPHLNVEGNLKFPLKSPIQKGRWTEAAMEKRVTEIAELLQITPYLHRSINQLSGGQQQRVSLGRALVRHPKVMLLDEPVTHLDARLRYSMRSELKRIHAVMGTTTIHVTHDQQEALAMADLLVILRNGRIEQAGPAMDVYRDPETRFVAGFLGDPPRTMLDVTLVDDAEGRAVQFGQQRLRLSDEQARATQFAGGRAVSMSLDAGDATQTDTGLTWTGEVKAHENYGDTQRIVVDVAGQRVNLQVDASRHVAIGDRLRVAIDPSNARLFDGESGRRLRA